jgi:hypothetical protein
MQKLNSKLVSRRNFAVLAVAIVATSEASFAQTWTGLTGNFSSATNWSPTGVPTSGTTTGLTFGGGGYTATNNLGSFTLNSLTSNLTSSATITGGTLTFDGSAPTITQNGRGNLTIGSAVQLNQDTTIGGSGTGAVNFTSLVSGSGGLINNYAGPVSLSGGASAAYLQVNAGTTTLSGSTAFGFTATGNEGVGGANPQYNEAISTGYLPGSSTLIFNGVTVNQGFSNNILFSQNSSSSSTVVITNGSSITNSDLATGGGRFGTGGGTTNLLINGGSVVNTRLIELGRVDGGTTYATVSGTGTVINGGQLVLGRANDTGSTTFGDLEVTNGGTVNVSTFIGSNSSSAGGIAFWGNDNSTGTVNVTSGGTFTCTGQLQLALAGGFGAAAGTANLNVSGPGSTFICTTSVTNGVQDGGANGVVFASDTPGFVTSINVSNGATFTAASIQHAFGGSGATAGELDVNVNTGATMTISGFLGLGGGGPSGSVGGVANLTVDNATLNLPGANFQTGYGDFGVANITFQNNAVVNETGGNGLAFGFNPGTVTTMTVQSGASFSTDGLAFVGLGSGSAATISVSGGTFNGTTLILSENGGTNGGVATFAVSNGGQAVFNGDLGVGGSTDNTGQAIITVDSGGTLTATGGLFMGNVSTVALTGSSLLQVGYVDVGTNTSIGQISIGAGSKLLIGGSGVTGGAYIQDVVSGSGILEINAPGLTQYFDVSPFPFTGTIRATQGTFETVFVGWTPNSAGGNLGTVEALNTGASFVVASFTNTATGVSPQAGLWVHTVRAINGGLVQVSNTVTGSLPTVIVTDTVDVGPSGSYTGLIDLTNNDMIVRQSTLAAVTAQLAAFFGPGGGVVGIGSSEAGQSTSDPRDLIAGLGVIPNNDGTGQPLYTTFDGVTVTTSDILIKYTYLGDTTLKGFVDSTDLANTLAGLNGGLTGWENGDFTYAGSVTEADVLIVLNALANQTTPFGGSGGSSGAVPEPAAIAPVVGLAMLGGRRRRR